VPPVDDLFAAQENIIALEKKLEEAKNKVAVRSPSPQQDAQNRATLTNTETELFWARRHLADIESANRE
jgi:hypothetical protein